MDHKTSDSGRAVSGSGEGSWWRWSRGKSGSISSSSDSVTYHGTSASTAGEMRTSRTGLVAREEVSPVPIWSVPGSFGSASVNTSNSPPKFFSSALSTSSRSSTSGSVKKKPATVVRREVVTTRKKPSSPSVLAEGKSTTTSERQPYTEITWSAGTTGKRKVSRREKKPQRAGTAFAATASTPAFGRRPARLTTEVPPHFEFGHTSREQPRSEPRFIRSEEKFPVPASSSSNETLAFKPESSTQMISSVTDNNRSQLNHQKTGDSLMNCARAVLQDCIRQRCMESSILRKRALESNSKVSATSKACESSPFSCGSSSSDDELSQLSALEPSWMCEKSNGDADVKLPAEVLNRERMLHNSESGSSPDFDRFSPFFEEKGLPVEIRYQLPLALGTANETDKECTICQLRYGIGDHIVTLPCQHFFHACCVDKWLWNHTSCPLCRTEVSLDSVVEPAGTKHQFTECPPVDQEYIRRKMRTQSAGFRPVVPATSELEQLHSRVAAMNICEDESADASELKYLVCPTPQRHQPK